MAVKDGEKLVAGAIESILDQTYKNLEFIIINDGSTDDTIKVIEGFNDPRIMLFSQENQGLSRSLNRGLRVARGEFIARQDHDDISKPKRLELQLDFLERNSEIGLVGSAAEIWSSIGPTGRFHDHPTSPWQLKFELLFNNPFVHTSWMFRRDVLKTVGYYTEDRSREPPEDYEFISRIAREYKVANLKERLVIYRELNNSLSSQIRPGAIDTENSFSKRMSVISAENFCFCLGGKYLDELSLNFGALVHDAIIDRPIQVDLIVNSLKKIAIVDQAFSGDTGDKNKLILDRILWLRLKNAYREKNNITSHNFFYNFKSIVKCKYYGLQYKIYKWL
jgi:glycosyltransferase involved in cell wall biosynthesis